MDSSIPPGSVVVAVDGSEHADRAVAWAAEQASLDGRRLVVVVAATAGDVAGGPDPVAQSIAEDATSVARTLRPTLEVEAMVLAGDPRQILVDLSAEARLLVVGSRGRGPLRTALLGSVSSAVVKNALCPVVVCRPPAETASGAGVVVGADGTAESVPVIEFAFQQASTRGLPLTVLHTYWDAMTAVAGLRPTPESAPGQPDVEDLRSVLSQSIAGLREQYPDVKVSLQLRHGLVDEVLVRDHSWDLVVVGRHPVDTLSRVLTGSISTAVVERARTTVAVVPEASPR